MYLMGPNDGQTMLNPSFKTGQGWYYFQEYQYQSSVILLNTLKLDSNKKIQLGGVSKPKFSNKKFFIFFEIIKTA